MGNSGSVRDKKRHFSQNPPFFIILGVEKMQIAEIEMLRALKMTLIASTETKITSLET